MQKLRPDKSFQQKPDICLHFPHCVQLSNRFVFVFARVRPPRMRRGLGRKRATLSPTSHTAQEAEGGEGKETLSKGRNKVVKDETKFIKKNTIRK